jgi:hypothetical protein
MIPNIAAMVYGSASKYKIPLLSELPTEEPLSLALLKAVLHIGHCASKSWLNKTMHKMVIIMIAFFI